MKKKTELKSISDLEQELSNIDLDAGAEIFEITDGISAGSIDASDGYGHILQILLRLLKDETNHPEG